MDVSVKKNIAWLAIICLFSIMFNVFIYPQVYAAEVIVDNSDAAHFTCTDASSQTDTWTIATDGSKQGADYRYYTSSTDMNTPFARWTTDTLTTGTYDLYINIPDVTNNDPKVQFNITDKDGTYMYIRTTQIPGWLSLGRFSYDNTVNSATVTMYGGTAGTVLRADAIKLVSVALSSAPIVVDDGATGTGYARPNPYPPTFSVNVPTSFATSAATGAVNGYYHNSQIRNMNAVWKPTITEAGYYEVYINTLFSSAGNNDPGALISVTHANGIDYQTIKCTVTPSGLSSTSFNWVRLGTYKFDQGENGATGNITNMRSRTTLDNVNLRADAVKLVKVDNPLPLTRDYSVSVYKNFRRSGTVEVFNASQLSGTIGFEIRSQPSHGTAAVTQEGGWAYTPETNYTGSDSFSVNIKQDNVVIAISTISTGIRASDYIVDNENAGTYSESPGWRSAVTTGSGSSQGPAPWGASQRISSAVGAWAKWNVEVPDGYYEAFYYNFSEGANDSNARIEVQHANGKTTIPYNNKNGTQAWNSLGIYRFNGDPDNYIKIRVNSSNAQVRADAIRLVSVTTPSLFFDKPVIEKSSDNGTTYTDITQEGLQQGLNRCTLYATNNNVASNPNTQVTLVAALYDANNLLIDCKFSQPVQLSTQGQAVPMQATINVPAVTAGMYMKLFTWNNMDGLKPYNTAVKINN